jgi:misacylated tRNA(Ala) deacylase
MQKTEMLYMADADANYIKDFDAKVIRAEAGYVILDRTIFYPLGGGQPSDKGELVLVSGGDGETDVRVTEVRKDGGVVKHMVDSDLLAEGDEVKGTLDWDRRYAHMRMHTAQHLVSGVVYDDHEAITVGNQIHANSSRIDFQPFHPDEGVLRDIEKKVNKVISKKLDVRITTMSREEADQRMDDGRTNMSLLPKFVKELRIVEIIDFDICPCAGTHIRNIGEIGGIRIVGKKNKGKGKTRVTYELVRPDRGY